jgi:parvulin-like peptidyl-prolyl isomerase
MFLRNNILSLTFIVMQNISRRIYFLLLSVLFPLTVLFAQEAYKSTSYVAKAGNIFISEREFVHRFELLPGFGRQRRSQLETAKAEFLYTMIAEKLLAQEAVARNLDRDTVLQQSLYSIRKKLSRDQLYYAEISQKVKISDVEIIRGVARAQLLPFTSYLFFKNKRDALFVRRQMKKSTDFESLTIDSSFQAIRDTATVIWGDAEPALEEALYKLKEGEISSVINAGTGYYVIKIIKVERNPEYSSLQPNVLRDRVVEIIRLRKERNRLDEYVNDVLRDKIGYSKPRPLIVLAQRLKGVYIERGTESNGLFASEVMKEVRNRCHDVINDTLCVIGNSYWAVGNVIDKLTNKYVLVAKADSSTILNILNRQIQTLVQQELLEVESLRRGMDQVPAVKEKLEMWREALLASEMKEIIRRRTGVTDAEIFSFMKSTESTVEVPQIKIRQLITSSLNDMKEALAAIQQGLPFEKAVREWSVDTVTKYNGGITDFFPISEHSPIGELAWKMNVGQRYGPVSIENKYTLFEVLDKKEKSNNSDTTFAVQFEKAKAKLLTLKNKQAMNIFIAQTGQDRGFSIYEERLKNISVTPIPMMTYRILGFGGKIIEVPFVDPQLDWLNVDPQKTKIVP